VPRAGLVLESVLWMAANLRCSFSTDARSCSSSTLLRSSTSFACTRAQGCPRLWLLASWQLLHELPVQQQRLSRRLQPHVATPLAPQRQLHFGVAAALACWRRSSKLHRMHAECCPAHKLAELSLVPSEPPAAAHCERHTLGETL
jgi:hypothetical protein